MKKVVKKVTTPKVQEITVYIAADGTEFESEKEAKSYECSLRYSIWNSLPGWTKLESIEGMDDGYEVTFFSTNGRKKKAMLLLELLDIDLNDVNVSWKAERAKKLKDIIEKGETFIINRIESDEEHWVSWRSLESHIKDLEDRLNPSNNSKKKSKK